MNKTRKIAGGLNTPCTITEAVQISRGVAEDVLAEYQANQQNYQISLSIQVELLKRLVLSKGLISEEEFHGQYMEEVKKIQDMQMKMREESNPSAENPKMDIQATDIDVQLERR